MPVSSAYFCASRTAYFACSAAYLANLLARFLAHCLAPRLAPPESLTIKAAPDSHREIGLVREPPITRLIDDRCKDRDPGVNRETAPALASLALEPGFAIPYYQARWALGKPGMPEPLIQARSQARIDIDR